MHRTADIPKFHKPSARDEVYERGVIGMPLARSGS